MVDLNVGKTGLTHHVLEAIKTQLERHGELKVKFLPSCANRKELVTLLPQMVGAKKKSSIGFVVVLQRQ